MIIGHPLSLTGLVDICVSWFPAAFQQFSNSKLGKFSLITNSHKTNYVFLRFKFLCNLSISYVGCNKVISFNLETSFSLYL